MYVVTMGIIHSAGPLEVCTGVDVLGNVCELGFNQHLSSSFTKFKELYFPSQTQFWQVTFNDLLNQSCF